MGHVVPHRILGRDRMSMDSGDETGATGESQRRS
jgi:hypothetical protein